MHAAAGREERSPNTCVNILRQSPWLAGSILKKLVDAVKELCTEVNFDVSTAGIGMQAMDSSHVGSGR